MTLDTLIEELTALKSAVGGKTHVRLVFQPKTPRVTEVGAVVTGNEAGEMCVYLAALSNGLPAPDLLVQVLEWV